MKLKAVAIALMIVGLGSSQDRSATRPEFEVSSIRVSKPDCRIGELGPVQVGPDSIRIECTSVGVIIRWSYGLNGKGRDRFQWPAEVLGGPKWLDTDRYDISVKASGETGLNQMLGPMFQALMEDRFQLRLHSEFREHPIYALTVAKGGSKLRETKEGSCVPFDSTGVFSAPVPPDSCGRMTITGGAIRTAEAFGRTLPQFFSPISSEVGRPIVDKTGLVGLYDIHLEYSPLSVADTTGNSSDQGGRSIFTAVQEQLGLKLSPGSGRVEVFVIDRLERPSEN